MESRDFHLASYRRSPKRDRNITIEVILFPRKNFMLAHMDNDIEISGSATTNTGFSITQRTNSRAIVDSSRYLHSDPRPFFLPAVSAAFSTRTFNHLSRSSAPWTGLRNLKKTAGGNDLTAALASRTSRGAGTRFCTRPATMSAGLVLQNFNLFIDTKRCFFQAYLQVVPEIRPTLSSTPVGGSSRAKNLIENPAATFASHSKYLAKDIKWIMKSSGTRTSWTAARPKRRMPKLVICSTFVLVHENLISLSNLLKLLFRCGVAGIFIGMILHGELAINFLYFLRARAARYSQYFIVISFRSHSLCRGVGFCRVLSDRHSL